MRLVAVIIGAALAVAACTADGSVVEQSPVPSPTQSAGGIADPAVEILPASTGLRGYPVDSLACPTNTAETKAVIGLEGESQSGPGAITNVPLSLTVCPLVFGHAEPKAEPVAVLPGQTLFADLPRNLPVQTMPRPPTTAPTCIRSQRDPVGD